MCAPCWRAPAWLGSPLRRHLGASYGAFLFCSALHPSLKGAPVPLCQPAQGSLPPPLLPFPSPPCRELFGREALAAAVSQLMTRAPLPALFMRTVIQSLAVRGRELRPFVVSTLGQLVGRQIWNEQARRRGSGAGAAALGWSVAGRVGRSGCWVGMLCLPACLPACLPVFLPSVSHALGPGHELPARRRLWLHAPAPAPAASSLERPARPPLPLPAARPRRRMQMQWRGWVMAAQQAAPESFPAWLQLPTGVLRGALQGLPEPFKRQLAEYGLSPRCTQSVPRPTQDLLTAILRAPEAAAQAEPRPSDDNENAAA